MAAFVVGILEMADDTKHKPEANEVIPFAKLASSIDPEKEAWKAEGNRFTPEQLKQMATTWLSAEIVEETGPDYRVG